MTETNFKAALLAGASAGVSVDLSLFPLDTVKTRLQSPQGFWKAGGFRGIYSGLLPVVIGSAPTAALFFCTYELTKTVIQNSLGENWATASHMMGASLGEVSACFLRVPVEVVKQRAQANSNLTSRSILVSVLKQEGFLGLYRGYFSTVIREMPFSFIQFPIWEHLKMRWSSYQGKPVDPWQSAMCGAVSGCIGAGVTTPLDVAKTRIMLAKTGTPLATGNIHFALKTIYAERGPKGLFAGLLPRVMWISIGGAVFLGVYDKVKVTIIDLCEER
ncbi:S-adenosylmethionine mitochondrial carrier protein-like [Mizuhopecten yessoensis]|uniref:S-adenosylmethionine mitochondrial carrier protein-like n=1 Tax=Mizuhopecten yessoensis TaxID=6573 RepID=UPI000B45BD42|nr:S-adenosylmethionine mitochondrial carrier protein-like [Mizuhopecten yessoensis]XP_021367537.1 S-adenosylmethionine mitochondrial carrier protein-like [Mizuhopecten yessoensis]XP_021367538.1 S-adenosylmethionine mitochondrial carrier protein-like [Mizuhopecten yessoensis]XP_021367540.1 S-adenosylmethionine mitochondrial carrier protein-like [Mizuhopecten yessoensis]XP_021367541.1 S-adenosylmethionine mitochondrial carrier protein-like [Mizuhopecten yessoensis]